MKSVPIPADASPREIVALARSEQLPIWTDGNSVLVCQFRPEGFHFFGAIASDMAVFSASNDDNDPTSPKPALTPRQLIERMAEAVSQSQNELRERLSRRAA